MGIANPKASLWFGEKTRKRSCIVYATVMGIAVAGFIEVNLIALGIYKYEDRLMASFYENIEVGSPIHEARNLSVSLNKHLRYSYALSEREKALVAYGNNRNYVDFSYPNQFKTSRLIVETSLHPGREEARVLGKYLIVNNRITKSNI